MPQPPPFPPSLPISAHADEIAAALRTHQVVVVSGDTGSGKTTQLPKICLLAGRGRRGLIGVTQPRRLACIAMARRVAEEFGEPVGGSVGYRHRFESRLSEKTVVKFMTDGILLAETSRDRLFRAYDTIILDEAHERSLNIDFLLGILHTVLPRRSDLKLIVSSATLDVKRFSAFFDDAPVISVPGRLFPVETRWRPGGDEDDLDLPRQVANAVDECAVCGEGDILVFLPGERDIREAQEVLTGRHLPHTEIIPLLASLPASEQQRAFRTGPDRRVILATNVAETSLTIPGIRYVVDSGLARIKRYNPRTHVQRLQIEPISQASANQRLGRCGRTAPGVCIRLYDEESFRRRDTYTPPEILRSSLAGVILRMLDLRLGDITAFPFLDPPSAAAVRDGYAELRVLGALGGTDVRHAPRDTRDAVLSPLGRKLARLPVTPAYGRILFAAAAGGVLEEALVIVAFLECDDPRRRPLDQREEAERLHARFLSPVSDFLGILSLWRWYRNGGSETAPATPPSQTALRRLCKVNFLSFPKMREWCDLRDQLADLCRELELRNTPVSRLREDPALRDAALHRALLAGLVTSVGHRDPETNEYRGTRGIRFSLFPGSGLLKKEKAAQRRAAHSPEKPRPGALPASRDWVMTGDLVETSRLFARTAACIDPAWIEPVARPICSYSYHSPEWDSVHGFVRVRERVVLLGLLLSDGRRRDDSKINPPEARALFIRFGLVEGAFPKPVPPFLQENLRRIRQLQTEEEKTRNHGLLFDPETAVAFYDARIPSDVCSAPSLRDWLAGPEGEARAASLTMKPGDLPSARNLSADFPEAVTLAGKRFRLSYRHNPGGEDDGVTCTVSAAELPALDGWRADWLVPGMLDEKLHWMLTSLPSKIRRLLVPVNDTLARLRSRLVPGRAPLTEAVSRALAEEEGIRIPPDTWCEDTFPPHLRMRFAVLDAEGKLLGVGRDLAALRSLYGAVAPAETGKAPRAALTWEFGDLPAAVNVGQAGWAVVNTPALALLPDDTVTVRLFADAAIAAASHEAALCRLFRHTLGREWARCCKAPALDHPAKRYLGELELAPGQLGEQIARGAVREAFLTGLPPVRTKAAFEERAVEGRGRLPRKLADRGRLVAAVLHAAAEAEDLMEEPGVPQTTLDDLAGQLAWLVFPGFAESVSDARLAEYPRYLEACRIRLTRARLNPAGDERKQAQIAPYWERYETFVTAKPRPPHDAAALEAYRWLVEEFRVSLFAQELRTPVPASAKRLEEKWNSATNV